MNRQDRGGGFRLSLTPKGFAAGARQDPGGMPGSGGTGFSLSRPACGRIFSPLLSEGLPPNTRAYLTPAHFAIFLPKLKAGPQEKRAVKRASFNRSLKR